MNELKLLGLCFRTEKQQKGIYFKKFYYYTKSTIDKILFRKRKNYDTKAMQITLFKIISLLFNNTILDLYNLLFSIVNMLKLIK